MTGGVVAIILASAFLVLPSPATLAQVGSSPAKTLRSPELLRSNRCAG